VWQRLFEHLAADADNEYAMIDSTIEIHALVDALGNPLRFFLTPGQVHDLTGSDALLPQMAADQSGSIDDTP
jgi:hypothetical protein